MGKNIIDRHGKTVDVTFNELLDMFSNSVHDIAHKNYGNLSNFMDFDDLVQEITISLYRAYVKYSIDDNIKFSTFFYTIADNSISNLIRHHTRDMRYTELHQMSIHDAKNEHGIPIEELIGDGIDYQGNVIGSISVDNIFSKLNSEEREILQLQMDGKNGVEISKTMDIPSSTLYRKIDSLNKKTKELLKDLTKE